MLPIIAHSRVCITQTGSSNVLSSAALPVGSVMRGAFDQRLLRRWAMISTYERERAQERARARETERGREKRRKRDREGQRERERERETERKSESEREREREREREKKRTDRQTDRRTGGERERQKGRARKRERGIMIFFLHFCLSVTFVYISTCVASRLSYIECHVASFRYIVIWSVTSLLF